MSTSSRVKHRDRLFSRHERAVQDFDFGVKTAQVFDDMLNRSVPFYQEIQRMLLELTLAYAQNGTAVYDLGCSTGNTLIALDAALPPTVRLVGVDNSAEMLHKAREKFSHYRMKRRIKLVCADFNRKVDVPGGSVVIMNLSLQFVRPIHRHRVVAKIARELRGGGCLLLVEKVLGKTSPLNRLFINKYHTFKERSGYSQLEIAQKREALENVLIPYRLEEDKELLRSEGFEQVDVFFKWYNFCGIVAVK